jgi:hypothetical protein
MLRSTHLKLLTVQYPPVLSYLIPYKSKYLPQRPIGEHPQPTLLLECERPSFTIMYTIVQNYSPTMREHMQGNNNSGAFIPSCVFRKSYDSGEEVLNRKCALHFSV